jgi:pilus assembly protein TadC
MAAVTIVGLVVGGDWWGSFSGSIGPLVIFTRMGLFGMGELALIAALGWLFLSAKVWKVI